MGLDITAYEKVSLVRAMTVQQANAEDYDPYPREETLLYVDHPSRMQHDGMTEGAYAYKGKIVAFRAGSYGGYNLWRDELADMVGMAHAGTRGTFEGPFAELIHFADNEGFIGPKTARKLAADFVKWRTNAHNRGPAFSDLYEDFAKAFKLASKSGAVKFH